MTDQQHHASDVEPMIHELLEDPIAKLLMQIDGVEREMLDPLLEEITQKVGMSREVA